jgi:Fe-S cluster assembly ATP-binding protein
MLSIKNLHVSVGDKPILKGINLEINAGEIHAIMGPNGSGKSTLSHILSGKSGYTVTEGSVTYQGKELLEMPPEIRAREGVFFSISVSGRDSWR